MFPSVSFSHGVGWLDLVVIELERNDSGPWQCLVIAPTNQAVFNSNFIEYVL